MQKSRPLCSIANRMLEKFDIDMEKVVLVLSRNEFLLKKLVDKVKSKISSSTVLEFDLSKKKEYKDLERLMKTKGLFGKKGLVLVKMSRRPPPWDILEFAHRRRERFFTIMWTRDIKVFEELKKAWKRRKVTKIDLPVLKRFAWKRREIVKELFKERGKEIQDDAARLLVELFQNDFRLESEIDYICDCLEGSWLSISDIERIYERMLDEKDYLFNALCKVNRKQMIRIALILRSLPESERLKLTGKVFMFLEQALLAKKEWTSMELKEYQNTSFALSNTKLEKLKGLRDLPWKEVMRNLMEIL